MIRDVAMLDYAPKHNAVSKRRRQNVNKFKKEVYIDAMGRQQISYDGDYIEENKEYDEINYPPKRRKEK